MTSEWKHSELTPGPHDPHATGGDDSDPAKLRLAACTESRTPPFSGYTVGDTNWLFPGRIRGGAAPFLRCLLRVQVDSGFFESLGAGAPVDVLLDQRARAVCLVVVGGDAERLEVAD